MLTDKGLMSRRPPDRVDAEATEEFYRREFTAYNPAGSVGITCNGRGQICGISLDEDALTTDENCRRDRGVGEKLRERSIG